MADQSLMSRLSSAVLPAVSKRVFPAEWLEIGDDQDRLIDVAKKRRSSDGPRPDMILQRSWGRASTEIHGRDLHLLTPNGGSTGRVLFYCHGGAFVVGPSSLEWLFAARFAAAIDCDLALYEYPKVPEVNTDMIRQATLAAYDMVAARYDHVVIGGTSAGGGLAVSTMLQLHRDGKNMPQAAVLISPWLDVTVSHADIGNYIESDKLLPVESIRRDGALYAGSNDPTTPLVSPRFASASDFAALPPTVVTAGEHEILLPEGREFVDNVQAAGGDAELVLEPYGQHVGVLASTSEGKAAVAACAAFLRPHIGQRR